MNTQSQGKWYVMQGTRYGWETYKGPFDFESDAQACLRNFRHTTINPLRVMNIR